MLWSVFLQQATIVQNTLRMLICQDNVAKTPNICEHWRHLPPDKLHWPCEHPHLPLHPLKRFQQHFPSTSLQSFGTESRMTEGCNIYHSVPLVWYDMCCQEIWKNCGQKKTIQHVHATSYGIWHSCIKHHHNPAPMWWWQRQLFFFSSHIQRNTRLDSDIKPHFQF